MTMLQLIEKLKKEHGDTGCYAVLRDWYQEYLKHDCYLSYRDKIIGFLYGLNATGYLSDNDVDFLIMNL